MKTLLRRVSARVLTQPTNKLAKTSGVQPLLNTAVTLSMLMVVAACSGSKLKLPEQQPAKLVKLTANQTPLQLRWSQNVGGGNSDDPLRLEVVKINSPVQGTASVYLAASRAGDVTAFNDAGKRLWSVDVNQPITSGVGANDNTVIVVDDSAVVHAFNPVDGSLVWKKQLSSAVLSPALVNDSHVVLAANNGVITGLDSNTGQTRWNFALNLPSFSLRGTAKPIELAKNFAVVASADGRVHAMRTDSGVPMWARRVGISKGSSEFDRLNDVDADPVFYKFVLYTASFQGQVVGIDMNTRQELFQIPVSSTKSVGVNDDNLFVATTEGMLNAYDRLTGKAVWSLDTLKNRQLSNPVAVNETTVVVGDLDGYLHSIDALTGKYMGRVRTSGAITQLVMSDGELLVQTDNGTVSVWQVA